MPKYYVTALGTERNPAKGDLVRYHKKDEPLSLPEQDWHLKAGEICEVVDANEDRSVRLQSATHGISHWIPVSEFNFVAKEGRRWFCSHAVHDALPYHRPTKCCCGCAPNHVLELSSACCCCAWHFGFVTDPDVWRAVLSNLNEIQDGTGKQQCIAILACCCWPLVFSGCALTWPCYVCISNCCGPKGSFFEHDRAFWPEVFDVYDATALCCASSRTQVSAFEEPPSPKEDKLYSRSATQGSVDRPSPPPPQEFEPPPPMEAASPLPLRPSHPNPFDPSQADDPFATPFLAPPIWPSKPPQPPVITANSPFPELHPQNDKFQPLVQKGLRCSFWFILASEIRNCEDSVLPCLQQLQMDKPSWLVQRTLTFEEACQAKYHDILAVSHRWEQADAPDEEGKQLQALRSHLQDDASISFVWFDYWCMPQGRLNESEQTDFDSMLASTSLLFLGAKVLVLADLCYMSRFWTQLEAWLAMQRVSREGLVSSSASERRLRVLCIHNTPASLENTLIDMWADRTIDEARALLSKPDMLVRNQEDKHIMLDQLSTIDVKVSQLVDGWTASFSPELKQSFSRDVQGSTDINSTSRSGSKSSTSTCGAELGGEGTPREPGQGESQARFDEQRKEKPRDHLDEESDAPLLSSAPERSDGDQTPPASTGDREVIRRGLYTMDGDQTPPASTGDRQVVRLGLYAMDGDQTPPASVRTPDEREVAIPLSSSESEPEELV